MNIANKLTTSRMLLTVVFLLLIRHPSFWAAVLATAVFALASLTDYLDGYFARKYDLITDFGKLMDPIADKFLMLSAFIVFVGMNLVNDWMVAIIVGREVIVTGFRLFALKKNMVLMAEKAGKHKTVSQVVVIFLVLGFIMFQRSSCCGQTGSTELEILLKTGIDLSMMITVLLALTSGLSFIWVNRKIIQSQ
jgi:CDP-diacylglycerol---glycerol-3-phosphate 3-phosphatidyltransferase